MVIFTTRPPPESRRIVTHDMPDPVFSALPDLLNSTYAIGYQLMKLLVLQHIACEHPGQLREYLNRDGVDWQFVELDEGEKIPSLEPFDALWVMGGPMDRFRLAGHPRTQPYWRALPAAPIRPCGLATTRGPCSTTSKWNLTRSAPGPRCRPTARH